MTTDRCPMVGFYFISQLNCIFSPPQYFPIFTSSRLQVLFKRVRILITTSFLATRALGWLTWMRALGVEQRSKENGIHQVSTSPLILGTSFSGLSMLNNKLVIVWNEVSMA